MLLSFRGRHPIDVNIILYETCDVQSFIFCVREGAGAALPQVGPTHTWERCYASMGERWRTPRESYLWQQVHSQHSNNFANPPTIAPKQNLKINIMAVYYQEPKCGE